MEIDFEDKIQALILLATLPNSWEPKRATIRNFVGSKKLKFSNIRDCILVEEVWRIDFGDALTSFVLNVDNIGRNKNKSTKKYKRRSKSKNGRDQSRSRRAMESWN